MRAGAPKDSMAPAGPESMQMRGKSHPASKPFRDCRAQMRLAMSQREEDPARVWLELVSIRETASKLPDLANDDAALKQDIERFRAKLEAEIFALQQEVGDEVLAPLYVWVDLIRRRNRLDRDIVTARESVKAARAARRDTTRAARSEQEAVAQLEEGQKKQEWWQTSVPPRPSEAELALWEAGGWHARRDALTQDAREVARLGCEARERLGVVAPGRLLARSDYVGSTAEKLIVGGAGAFGLVTTIVAAYALLGASTNAAGVALGVLAAVGWLGIGAAVGVSVAARKRVRAEIDDSVATSWHWTLFSEQAAAMEIEVGWLRALRDAFHARAAFDKAKSEGKQIEELKAWRADLRDFVVEVAARGDDAATAEVERAKRSLMPASYRDSGGP